MRFITFPRFVFKFIFSADESLQMHICWAQDPLHISRIMSATLKKKSQQQHNKISFPFEFAFCNCNGYFTAQQKTGQRFYVRQKEAIASLQTALNSVQIFFHGEMCTLSLDKCYYLFNRIFWFVCAWKTWIWKKRQQQQKWFRIAKLRTTPK